MPRKLFPQLSSQWSERLAFLAALDPVNARAFLKTISAFKDDGVEFMFLCGNDAALALLSGTIDCGPLARMDWLLAWILRRVGALEATVPCFTVAVRANPGNVARFKSAWASLDFGNEPPAVPATLTWTFIPDASYKGVLLETLWDKRRLVSEIDGCALYQAPDMMGFSRS
jgi:hypothetical protein